jgi:hypothetical protein
VSKSVGHSAIKKVERTSRKWRKNAEVPSKRKALDKARREEE